MCKLIVHLTLFLFCLFVTASADASSRFALYLFPLLDVRAVAAHLCNRRQVSWSEKLLWGFRESAELKMSTVLFFMCSYSVTGVLAIYCFHHCGLDNLSVT